MKEPTAEHLAGLQDVHLELLVDRYMFELQRRNPRRAETVAETLVLLMRRPNSSAEPFPHMESA
jgi:hypothetical protein